MLRAWQDVVVKWQLVPDDQPVDHASDGPSASWPARALLAGEPRRRSRRFEAASRARADPLDRVGIGDVHLARGGWRSRRGALPLALRHRRARPRCSRSWDWRRHKIGQDTRGEAAIADLEQLVADRPADPVLRYYLASAWYSVAEQCRVPHGRRRAGDHEPRTSWRSARTPPRASSRWTTGDEELDRGAEQLLGRGQRGPALELGHRRSSPRAWPCSTVALGLITRGGGRAAAATSLLVVRRRRASGAVLLFGIVLPLPPPDLAVGEPTNWRRSSRSTASPRASGGALCQ